MIRTYVNLMLVMLIGGFWHGASWNFVIWGAIHGRMLALERMQGRAGSYDAAAEALADRHSDIRRRLHLVGLLPGPDAAAGTMLSRMPLRHGRGNRLPATRSRRRCILTIT